MAAWTVAGLVLAFGVSIVIVELAKLVSKAIEALLSWSIDRMGSQHGA